MDWKQRTKQLKLDIPAVFLALRRRDTPFPAKVFAALAVGYALSPVDLIPDVIPVLGYLDDILLLPGLVALSIRFIPEDILAECREQAGELWRDGKPVRWYWALPVVAVWLLLAVVLVKWIWF